MEGIMVIPVLIYIVIIIFVISFIVNANKFMHAKTKADQERIKLDRERNEKMDELIRVFSENKHI